MTVTTRKSAGLESNGVRNNAAATNGSRDEPSSSSGRTISYAEALKLLPWQTDNDHILHGYRRQVPSLKGCIWSSFAYLHNETVNIHSHSLGALFFAILIPMHLYHPHLPTWGLLWPSEKALEEWPVPPTLHDKVALVLNLLCAVTCLGLSSWFHTVSCHSRDVCELAHRGDYLGIVILTCGSIIPGLYYAFDRRPHLQIIYVCFILLAGVATSITVLSPKQRAHRWRRTLAFIALGLSSVVPIAHVIISQGIAHARDKVSLDLIIAGGASYIFGAVLYAARIPERFSPGTFDYFGASHQIFHCFVLGGAGLQYAALRGMVWGRSTAMGSSDVGLSATSRFGKNIDL